jgi:AraC-like DNA-binding protein
LRAKGRARIAVWEGGSLWLLETGRGFDEADEHAHHAVQVTIALDGRFEVETARSRRSALAVAVAPDAPHRFRSQGLIGFLFVAPEGRLGRALAERWFGKDDLAEVGAGLPEGLLDRLRPALDQGMADSELTDIGRALAEGLAGGGAPARLPDARIRAVIAAARERPDSPPTLAEAAALAGLSPGRLRHLFVEETGLPLKSYWLWQRLGRAVDGYGRGASLTEAAHDAGFADSAHFSRTFRRTFGAPATALRRTSPSVQSPRSNRL